MYFCVLPSCVSMYYIVLPCVTMHYHVLPSTTMLLTCVTSVLPCTTLYCHVLLCYHVLPCVSMYYIVLPCVTIYNHVLPCTTMCHHLLPCVTTMCYHVFEQFKKNEMQLTIIILLEIYLHEQFKRVPKSHGALVYMVNGQISWLHTYHGHRHSETGLFRQYKVLIDIH